MQKGLKKVAAVFLLLLLAGCFHDAEEEKKPQPHELANQPAISQLTIALGKSDGVNFAAGRAICAALKKSGSSLSCKLNASDGSRQNLRALSSGLVELALVRADSAYHAWHGHQPFNKRDAKLRVLFSLHQDMATLLVKDASNIFSFGQTSGKAINIGPKNSSDTVLLNEITDICNVDGENFSEESGEVEKLFAKSWLQGSLQMTSHPDDKLKALAKTTQLQFLPINGQCIEQLVDGSSYLSKTTIPGNLYNGIPSDIPSVGSKYWLIAKSDLMDSAVYEVVKAVFEGVEQFRRSDPAFYRLSPRKMLSSFAIPFHTGAVFYYKEKGWYKER